MSASKEKRVRSTIRSEGGDKKSIAAAEKAKKDKKFKRNVIIVVVVVAILVACAAVINSNILYTGTTAVQIGDTKYSPAEYNFYFNGTYTTMYSQLSEQYGDLVSYLLDTSKPLDEQIYLFGDGETTWADVFHSETIAQMTNITILYDAAIKEGYTLSDEDKAEIESTVQTYLYSGQTYGYESLDAFLAVSFGKGVDEALLRAELEKQIIAGNYSEAINDSFTYNDDQLEEYYVANQEKFDFVTYHSYYISTTNAAFEDMSDEEKIAAAHDAAAKIADADSVDAFTANVVEFVSEDTKATYEDPSATLSITQGANISSEDYKAWLMDESRVEGDTAVVDIEGGSCAFYFVSRNDNNYNTVDARHILIQAEAAEDGSYTDEALANAKARAEELYEIWKSDPTEDHFIELAKAESADSGSSANGGLYVEIFKDYMVEEFDAFLFEEGRLPGDTGIVYGTNGNYAGYHIIYFVGHGDNYRQMLADDGLRAEDYNEAVSAMAESYAISSGFGMRFTGK